MTLLEESDPLHLSFQGERSKRGKNGSPGPPGPRGAPGLPVSPCVGHLFSFQWFLVEQPTVNDLI